jgi:hypothetical protein
MVALEPRPIITPAVELVAAGEAEAVCKVAALSVAHEAS